MTNNAAFQAIIRERMRDPSERYAAERAPVLNGSAHA